MDRKLILIVAIFFVSGPGGQLGFAKIRWNGQISIDISVLIVRLQPFDGW